MFAFSRCLTALPYSAHHLSSTASLSRAVVLMSASCQAPCGFKAPSSAQQMLPEDNRRCCKHVLLSPLPCGHEWPHSSMLRRRSTTAGSARTTCAEQSWKSADWQPANTRGIQGLVQTGPAMPTCMGEASAQGSCPVASSHSTTPKDHTSDFSLYDCERSTSGAHHCIHVQLQVKSRSTRSM